MPLGRSSVRDGQSSMLEKIISLLFIGVPLLYWLICSAYLVARRKKYSTLGALSLIVGGIIVILTSRYYILTVPSIRD